MKRLKHGRICFMKHKSQHNRERTAMVPHRVMKKTSIALAKAVRVDCQNFLGYESVTEVLGGTISVRSGSKITPRDMRMFHFVLSQWQAHKKSKKENIDEMIIDISMIIEALGWKNRTENRRKIINHLERMVNVSISYTWDRGKITFSTLEFVKVLDTGIVSIGVSGTYDKALDDTKRYINVEHIMPLKSDYAMELYNYIQMEGSGVKAGGIPETASFVNHAAVCRFLHLPNTQTSVSEIRRAFKALEKTGVPRYELKTIQGNKIWHQNGRNITKKALEKNT